MKPSKQITYEPHEITVTIVFFNEMANLKREECLEGNVPLN
jgi:hypothetical protein